MIVLGVIVVIIVGLILWVIGAKNKIVREEQNVLTEYNNAKVVVDRRFKNLGATINLMKSHNKSIAAAYKDVIAMRSGSPMQMKSGEIDPEGYAKMDNMMQDIVKNVNVTLERYPELGKMFDADKFAATMAQHDRDVEMAKKLYNHEVEEFNTLILTIPYSFVAGGKTKYNYWEITESESKDEYIPDFE